MVLEYLPTKLGDVWGKCRCAYSSTMVRIWDFDLLKITTMLAYPGWVSANKPEPPKVIVDAKFCTLKSGAKSKLLLEPWFFDMKLKGHGFIEREMDHR